MESYEWLVETNDATEKSAAAGSPTAPSEPVYSLLDILEEGLASHRQRLIERVTSKTEAAFNVAETSTHAVLVQRVRTARGNIESHHVAYQLLFCHRRDRPLSQLFEVEAGGTSVALATTDPEGTAWSEDRCKAGGLPSLLPLVETLQAATALPAFYCLVTRDQFVEIQSTGCLYEEEGAIAPGRDQPLTDDETASAIDIVTKKGAAALASFLLDGPAFVAQEHAIALLDLFQRVATKVGLDVPCFVPTGSLKRQLFFGQRQTRDQLDTRFKMLAPAFLPPQCDTLRGMLQAFQDRVQGYGEIQVEGQLSYVVQEPIADTLWTAAFSSRPDGASAVGPWFSPIERLTLHTYFPTTSAEHLPLDTPILPSACSSWRLCFDIVESSSAPGFVAGCRLAEHLKTLLLSWQAHAVHLFSLAKTNDTEEATKDGDTTTDGSSTEEQGEKRRRVLSPSSHQQQAIRAAKIVQASLTRGVLQALNVDGTKDLYPEHEPGSRATVSEEEDDLQQLEDRVFLSGHLEPDDADEGAHSLSKNETIAKMMQRWHEVGLPPSCVSFQLAAAVHRLLMSKEHTSRPPVGRLLHLAWRRIIAQLRRKWKGRHPMPFLATEVDTRYHLLAQKLAMLGHCAERRHRLGTHNNAKDTQGPIQEEHKLIERNASEGWTTFDIEEEEEKKKENVVEDEDDDDDEEVFFDTCEEVLLADMEAMNLRNEASPRHSTFPTDLRKQERKGAQTILAGQMLLHHPDAPIWVPQTQLPGPMTQDQLKAHQLQLQSFGDDAKGRAERMKLQSAGLQSDMAAFKAANPLACLEDFVRWHSPRDWVQDMPDAPFTLSIRMQGDDNLWRKTWQATEAQSVDEQAPLFDHEEEGESALRWLEEVSPLSLLTAFLPTFFLFAHPSLAMFEPTLMSHSNVQNRFDVLSRAIGDTPWQYLLEQSDLLHQEDAAAYTFATVTPEACWDLVGTVRALEGDLAIAHAFHHFLIPSLPLSFLPFETIWADHTLTFPLPLMIQPHDGDNKEDDRFGKGAKVALGRYFAGSRPIEQSYFFRTLRARPHAGQSRPTWQTFQTTLTEENRAFRATIALTSDVRFSS